MLVVLPIIVFGLLLINYCKIADWSALTIVSWLSSSYYPWTHFQILLWGVLNIQGGVEHSGGSWAFRGELSIQGGVEQGVWGFLVLFSSKSLFQSCYCHLIQQAFKFLGEGVQISLGGEVQIYLGGKGKLCEGLQNIWGGGGLAPPGPYLL